MLTWTADICLDGHVYGWSAVSAYRANDEYPTRYTIRFQEDGHCRLYLPAPTRNGENTLQGGSYASCTRLAESHEDSLKTR